MALCAGHRRGVLDGQPPGLTRKISTLICPDVSLAYVGDNLFTRSFSMEKNRRYVVSCWLLAAMLVFVSCNSSAARDPIAAADKPAGSAAGGASGTSGSAVVMTATGVPGDIAYAFQPGDNSHMFSIHTVNRDGTENKLLMSVGGIGLNQPAWSPDGKTIATWGWLSQYTISIYSFNTDGSGLTRLTAVNNVYDMFPDWSPDGKRLTFTRQYPNQNNRNEIWVMNSDGSAAALVAAGYQSKWRPDGKGLVFVSDKSGNFDIYDGC